MKKVTVAGGIVAKIENGVLKICLIKTTPPRTEYSFPKGHIEEGEQIESAAIREVREETGLENLEIIKYLGFLTRNSTEDWKQKTVKDIHLFLMRTKSLKHTNAEEEYDWFEIHESLNKLFFKEEKQFLEKNLSAIIEEKANF